MPKLEYSLPIYPFHIDAIGHVNNVIYIQWMEIGRVLLLEAVGMPIQEIAKAGFGPALIDTNISYKTPLYLGDQVCARIWLSQLRGASARMQFEFYNQQDDLAAVGSQRGLFIDLNSKKPKRLSSQQRKQFTQFLIEENSAQ